MIHAIVGTIAMGCVVAGFGIGIILLLEPSRKRRRGR
jgi:hypothetical protein